LLPNDDLPQLLIQSPVNVAEFVDSFDIIFREGRGERPFRHTNLRGFTTALVTLASSLAKYWPQSFAE
jgi:hypothetical protein